MPVSRDERIEALRLVNDEIDQRFDRQDAGTARLESKSSIFIGFAAVLGSVILVEARNVWGFVALTFLALAIAGFLLALKPRVSRTVPDPAGLAEEYELHNADAAVTEVLLAQLVGTKVDAFKLNVAADKARVSWSMWALRLLALGLLLTVPAFVVGSPEADTSVDVRFEGTPKVRVLGTTTTTTLPSTTQVTATSAPPTTTAGGAVDGP